MPIIIFPAALHIHIKTYENSACKFQAEIQATHTVCKVSTMCIIIPLCVWKSNVTICLCLCFGDKTQLLPSIVSRSSACCKVISVTDQSQAHPRTSHLLTANKFLTKPFKHLIGHCRAQILLSASCNVEWESNPTVGTWFWSKMGGNTFLSPLLYNHTYISLPTAVTLLSLNA